MGLALDQVVRKNVLNLTGYTSARSLAVEGRIFLDANEAPDDEAHPLALNRYPSPQPPLLRRTLAEFYGVEPLQICMGRGSDEAIDLLVRMTCEPGRHGILTCPPTYGMYGVAAELQGAQHMRVPMVHQNDQFLLNEQGIAAVLRDPAIKVFFICRPNNPTGETMTIGEIERLAMMCGPARLLVVDEAYLEFAQVDSAVSLIERYPNIVVLRTFSKAWALAGARFGVAISSPELAAILEKVRAPYPVPTPVAELVAQRLTAGGKKNLLQCIMKVNGNREKLRYRLGTMETVSTIYPSSANYLLAKVPGRALGLYTHLRGAGIVVRDQSSQPLLRDCLRVTIGSSADNDALLASWRDWEKKSDA